MKQILLLGLFVICACAHGPLKMKPHKIDYPPAAWGPVMDESSLQNDSLYRSR
jgi:hypothetical protein